MHVIGKLFLLFGIWILGCCINILGIYYLVSKDSTFKQPATGSLIAGSLISTMATLFMAAWLFW